MKKERRIVMKKGIHACIWLSLIAFFIFSLLAVIKVFIEKPFQIELLLGVIGRFMGSFLCAVFIPVGVLNLIFAYLFPDVSLGVSAGIMCVWIYFGGVICANVMYHWLKKRT